MTTAPETPEGVGPFENELYTRQVRQSLFLMIILAFIVLAFLTIISSETSSPSNKSMLIEIGVLALLLFEAVVAFVVPRYTFQARQLWADEKGVRLHWQYLFGSRDADLAWSQIKGSAGEDADHATLLLYWGPIHAFSSTILAFHMDWKSYAALKPVLEAYSAGIRVKS